MDTATNDSSEDSNVKAVHKRYEGLVTVRTKASVKGKGAWYWAHLEPVLVHTEAGVAKAVKLRCSLCDAMFSASNPSRTASEHLKRGTCPNFTMTTFNSPTSDPLRPISSIAPTAKKRPSSSSFQVAPLAALMDPTYSSSSTPPPAAPHLALSGGKEDLGALALLESSVKKLKSPKTSPGPSLSKSQADSAVGLLSDWFYESCATAAMAFSRVDHPKFKAFLHQVGLPPLSKRELAGARLDARYHEAKLDSEARTRDALFFQISAGGFKSGSVDSSSDALVSIAVNLPNGTAVFRKFVLAHGRLPSKYVEEILWEAASEICGTGLHRCAGIVADKFKSKALRNLESQNHWMVNLACQLQSFRSLLKDFAKEVPLFGTVVDSCAKVVDFVNTDTQARSIFRKYQLQEFDHSGLLRVEPAVSLLDDVIANARPLQMAVHDDSYKLLSLDDQNARELGEMVQGMAFWTNLDAIHSLVKLIDRMCSEIEAERPLVSQCLPIWEELRSKVKDWCSKFNVDEILLNKVVDKRFRKSYHAAWAAAFILDPLYLIKDASGKYLPPFKYLTPEQEKDVDKLITRLVSREEAHIVLMELMKWRSEGLDPLYAQAVQVKQFDPATGKMRVANPQSSRLVWETILSEEFKSLSKITVRLIFLHATSCGFKCGSSMLRWVSRHGSTRAGMERAQKMVFVAAHAKLKRRDFSNEEEKDAELFANEEEDVTNEGFVDSSSM